MLTFWVFRFCSSEGLGLYVLQLSLGSFAPSAMARAFSLAAVACLLLTRAPPRSAVTLEKWEKGGTAQRCTLWAPGESLAWVASADEVAGLPASRAVRGGRGQAVVLEVAPSQWAPRHALWRGCKPLALRKGALRGQLAKEVFGRRVAWKACSLSCAPCEKGPYTRHWLSCLSFLFA